MNLQQELKVLLNQGRRLKIKIKTEKFILDLLTDIVDLVYIITMIYIFIFMIKLFL